jgi:AraC-like DNA-binding protein
MSRKRQVRGSIRNEAASRVVVRSFAVRHFRDHVIENHAHDWHQLIYASEGVMWVHTAQGDWVVPPNRAVWVPAGVEHGIELTAKVLVQTIYLAAGISAELPRQCCAVNVSPLLRELIVHTVKLGNLDESIPSRARLIGFLIDQLSVLPAIALQLPLPADERARRAVAWLREHPDDPGLIKSVARRACSSARTLERLFRQETGMTFGKWRQQLRLLQAMQMLAAGRPVTAVALEVGYNSPSAFIAMFKRTLGTTPHRYFAPAEDPAGSRA